MMRCYKLQRVSNTDVTAKPGLPTNHTTPGGKAILHIGEEDVAAVRLARVARTAILQDATPHGRTREDFQLLHAHDLQQGSWKSEKGENGTTCWC
jgi:hypothetical protein